MRSSSSGLSRSLSTLLLEDSSSKLSVRILAVSSSTLNVRSKWLTFSSLLTVVYSFPFSTSFLRKLIKISYLSQVLSLTAIRPRMVYFLL